MVPVNDKKVISELIQDMRVKLRDIDNFFQSNKYEKIIFKFQTGFEEEYFPS